MRRLTVHIGAPKTGSTYLQRLLYDNRERLLRDQGILYPDVSLRGFGHHDIAFLLGGGYPVWAVPQDKPLSLLADELKQAVAGHMGDIILSSEDFYLCPNPRGLRRFLDDTAAARGRDVRILVYIRRQDDMHESWYNQTVKAQGETHSIAACVEKTFGLWDYNAQLEQWSAVFGRAAMVVRRYGTTVSAAGGLRRDFLAQAGIRDEGLALPPEEVNLSLNRDLLEFQRWINRLPVSPQYKRRFHKQLMELSRRCAGRGVFDESRLLDADARRSIMARYEESNDAVARTYLDGAAPFMSADAPNAVARVGSRGMNAGKLWRIVAWLAKGS
jgi:hypothetical protein